MTSPIDAPYALSYRLPIEHHEPLNRLVSEIFSIKVDDTRTDTSTDNKGRLKLSSRASHNNNNIRSHSNELIYQYVLKR